MIPGSAELAPPTARTRGHARLTAGLVATVVFLTATAPLATDMYVPAFPQVDLATSARLVRVLNVIAEVGGIAPIVGPLVGAVILQLSHWRVSFWVVAALGLAMTLAVLVAVPESLPPERRHGGGLRDFVVALAMVCFFVLMTAQGLIGPNGGALASAAVPEHSGTGSAVLGFVQWVAAGTIAPVAGLGGEHTAVPMATLMIACVAASMVGLLVLARPGGTPVHAVT